MRKKMKQRKRRIDKKLHKIWLDLEVIDLSQKSYWRERLFNSNKNQHFDINENNFEEASKILKEAIMKYKLKFKVCRVHESEADHWLSEGGNIVFKFWATNYPSLKAYTGNNPKVI